MFLILPHRLLEPVKMRQAILHGCCSWCTRMGFIGSLGPRYCITVCLYVYVCVWLLCSSVFTCGVFWVLCASYVGLLSIAPHPFMNTQVVCLAAAARMACSYLKVCSNGLIPTRLLVDALRFLKKSGLLNILLFCKLKLLWSYGIISFWYVYWIVDLSYGLPWSYVLMFLCSVACYPGRLMLGGSMTGAEEAHLSGVGNTIRMVMHHFIELKRCPVAKEVAFRKARL